MFLSDLLFGISSFGILLWELSEVCGEVVVENRLSLRLGLLGIPVIPVHTRLLKGLLQFQLISLHPQLWRILPPPDILPETKSERSCRCLIALKQLIMFDGWAYFASSARWQAPKHSGFVVVRVRVRSSCNFLHRTQKQTQHRILPLLCKSVFQFTLSSTGASWIYCYIPRQLCFCQYVYINSFFFTLCNLLL